MSDSTERIHWSNRLPEAASVAKITSLFVIVCGMAGLIGWRIDAGILKSVFPGLPAMSPATALGLVWAGLVLLGVARTNAPAGGRWLRLGALLLVSVCAVKVITAAASIDLVRLLFKQYLGALPRFPMNPTEAWLLLFAGIGLLAATHPGQRALLASQAGALLCGLGGFLTLTAFLHGVTPLYESSWHSGSSIHGAFALMALGCAILLLQPHRGIMLPLSDPGPGGTLVRRLIPLIILVPVLLGSFRGLGERTRLFSGEVGATLYITAIAIAASALILRIGGRIALLEDQADEAAEHLDQEREFLRVVLENVKDGIVACDQNGIVTLLNRATREFHGVSRRATSAERWAEHSDLYLPDGVTPLPGEDAPLMRALKGDPLIDAELMIAPKGGRPRRLLSSGYPLVDAKGRKIGAVAILHDITERRRAEEALQLSHSQLEARVEERTVELSEANLRLETEMKAREKTQAELKAIEENFSLLVEGVEDYGIVMLTPAGQVQSWNKGAHRLMGYDAEEIIGQSIAHFYLPEDIDASKVECELNAAKATGRFQDEGLRLRKNGSQFFAHVVITALLDELGKLRGFAMVTRDITERSNTQKTLMRAKLQAERANQAKSEILSRISHELRTPLNAIIGYAQLLEMDALEGEQGQNVEQVLSGANHLLRLVNEVLDISSLESAGSEAVIEPVLLSDVIEEALLAIRGEADPRQIALVSEVDCPPVMADRARLLQALSHLLSNAVKFNNDGGSVHLSVSPGANGFQRLSIRDTGCGIREDLQSRLYTAFDRLDAEERGIAGTGMGLVLAQWLLGSMDATIEVESAVNEGTTFTITLPGL